MQPGVLGSAGTEASLGELNSLSKGTAGGWRTFTGQRGGMRLCALVFVYSLLETPCKGVGAKVSTWLESAQDKLSLTHSPSWVWESGRGSSSWRTQDAPGARKGNPEETTSVPKRGCPHGLGQRDRRQVLGTSPWEGERGGGGREPRPLQLVA